MDVRELLRYRLHETRGGSNRLQTALEADLDFGKLRLRGSVSEGREGVARTVSLE